MMNGEYVLLSVLVFIFAFDYGKPYVTISNYCTTPDGKTGRCVPMAECEQIAKLRSSKLLSSSTRHQLDDYSCDYNKKPSKVCCPPGPLTLTEEVPPPPDVSAHPNLHLLPKDCAIITTDFKIRNGIKADLNEFPYMALLSFNLSTGPAFKCGGTVINERYILTAAHCVVTKDPLLGVRVGEYNLASRIDCSDPSDPDTCNPPVQDLAIEKAIIPEDYNITDHANDIALLRVTKMDFSEDYVQPVCLPVEEKTRNHEVTSGAATGWGYIDPELTIYPDILQKVMLDVRPLKVCERVHPFSITYKQMCIGGQHKKDSCSGDSGGPFQVPLGLRGEGRFVQFGIVSAGPQYCGYTGAPGIYTKIVYYMDWILDNLEP